jgi:hypothetical protein
MTMRARTVGIGALCGILALLIATTTSIWWTVTASASAQCEGSVGFLKCRHTTGPVGPSSVGVIAGSEYIGQSLACGPRRKRFDDAQFTGDAGCANYLIWCPLAPGAGIDAAHQIVAYQVFDTATRTLLRIDIGCDVPTGAGLPPIAAIKAEATRRAPHPHTTAGGTQYLINAAIVFYATPPAGIPSLSDLTIPRFSLAGHAFSIRLHLTHTSWDWADTTTSSYPQPGTTSTALGRPYDDSTPCENTTHCAHYISHPYRHPGTYTIHAQTHWSATYTLDNHPQQIPIPGDIHQTDPTGHTITTHQAHSQLIPPPNP